MTSIRLAAPVMSTRSPFLVRVHTVVHRSFGHTVTLGSSVLRLSIAVHTLSTVATVLSWHSESKLSHLYRTQREPQEPNQRLMTPLIRVEWSAGRIILCPLGWKKTGHATKEEQIQLVN